jgi:diguanylate cyclase (GGDEF)-like protein
MKGWFWAARRRFRLGIVGRLSISFIGVALLILGANLVVQQGILVERTTRVSAPPPPAAVAVAATPAPPPLAAPPDPSPQLLENALAALANYDEASRARIKSADLPVSATYKRAAADLSDALVPMGDTPRSELHAYTARASALIRAADAQRAAELSRKALVDSLNVRVKKLLAGAWTIFGRVVSRQSLVVLGDDLDSLRQHSEPLEGPSPLSATQISAIIAAEQRVQKTLVDNAAGFRGAQGNEWYQSMAADLTQVIALRESSIRLAGTLSEGLQAFADQGNQLRHTLFKARTAASPIARQQPAPAAVAAPPTVQAPGRSIVETKSITRMAAQSGSQRAIAWGSAAAALVMLLMCVGIVISIVRPARRLLRATAEIAAGRYAVRVASGGIAELDAIATAFNTMAEELASAKALSLQYQQGLEEKIQQRTRRLRELSQRDPLTALPNRRHLFTLLDAALERAQRSGHWVGVLFLDVDNFKYINDGLGHAFGDSVLKAMGLRLAEITREYGFAARLGGDEFTVVLECARTIEDVKAVGEALVAAFQSPMLIEGRELIVSISVGACAYPVHAQQSGALLKAADMALFRAKALGRSQLSIFTSDLAQIAAARFATEQGLRRAIERGEFELHFQPELDAETLEIGLVEALIRWRTGSGELIPPGEFLAVAEDSGLALEIGDWVLRAAISAASGWHRGPWGKARVAINVSSRQLADGNFVDRVQALLAEFALPPGCIEIELTESVLQTGPATIASLRRLRELGIAVALDDFGTGYSSLASLEMLPLSRVKLDRSLISGIDTNPRSAAIAEAIIVMCQKLGLQITAEGVERPQQFAYLVRQRSMFVQGFLLARAVPQHELMQEFTFVKERARELLISSRESPVTAVECDGPRQLASPGPGYAAAKA